MTTPAARAGAELSLSLLMCLARKVPYLNALTRTGVWVRTVFHELPGRTLGLLGFGPAARELVCMLPGFGLQCMAWDENPDPAAAERLGVRLASFEDVVRESHCLCIHLSAPGRTIIGPAQMESMREGALLINLSDASLVDDVAADKALTSGRLSGYAFCLSQPRTDSPLYRHDNVICVPRR